MTDFNGQVIPGSKLVQCLLPALFIIVCAQCARGAQFQIPPLIHNSTPTRFKKMFFSIKGSPSQLLSVTQSVINCSGHSLHHCQCFRMFAYHPYLSRASLLIPTKPVMTSAFKDQAYL